MHPGVPGSSGLLLPPRGGFVREVAEPLSVGGCFLSLIYSKGRGPKAWENGLFLRLSDEGLLMSQAV